MTVRIVLVNSVTEQAEETKEFYAKLFSFEPQGETWLSLE